MAGEEKPPRWYRHSAARALELLQSSAAGLTAEEARRRLAEHGANAIIEAPPRSRLALLAAQFIEVPILLLLGAAAISLLIGHWGDAVVIVAILLLNAVVGFFQECRASRALAALKSMTAPTAVALRDGAATQLPAMELVPGDVVLMEAGGIVPADLRLLEAARLRADEAALTGESVSVDKVTAALDGEDLPVGDRHNLLHKGTFVTHGRATGVVVATGMQTEFGRIAQLLHGAAELQTPLQRRLATLGRGLAAVVLVICVIVFVTGLLRGEPWVPMFMTALSLAVAAIPEALPAVVTVSLAVGARRMVVRQALIRRLPAVETLGSVTFICSDKTGTLTQNRMTAERFWCDGGEAATVQDSGPWRDFMQALALNNDVVLQAAPRAGADDAHGDAPALGDPTEVALFMAARAAGFDRCAQERQLPRVAELPFEAERKCMTTVHRHPAGGFLSITKGAAEVLLRQSVCLRRSGGDTALDHGALLQVAERMAAEGFRVMAVAARRWPGEQLPPVSAGTLERDQVFLGLVGLIDPPRAEARVAIADCLAAGIVPVMITGDHPLTALAVARRLGLTTEAGRVITGPELAALPMEEFVRRVGDLRVYARVSPEQKLKVVTALQQRGECVAMTGDGVNDAPALRQADIGVAMGITGTDVAKDASAMVLLDDNFATVVGAVREGRRIYDNLRRFIRYVVTTNSAEVWTIFLAPLLGLPIPLLPIQILWINLVSDGLPGLALAAEPAERSVMTRPPRRPDEGLFAGGLGWHALWVGLLMAALTLGAQAWYVHEGAAQAHWQTLVFTTLCFVQLGHVLAVRSERDSLLQLGLGGNPLLLGAVLLTAALQLAIIYVPALNVVFHTAPLNALEMGIAVGAALVVLAAVEIEKMIRRRP
ncbi:MAG TPA: cation-translocating P-type ATPase [Steroidobacteraceae bacterium]|nr:cation-translocating P-type ATPase [Steroidobacteraceae bacterium]